MAKFYTGGFPEYEGKLKKVMARLGVEKFNYDWTRQDCFVELLCKGRVFHFSDSLEAARIRGEKITAVSDVFARIVLMLEDLARASERGLYDFATIISGLPSLPESVAHLDPWFIALGFTEHPATAEEVRVQYRRLAKVLHPDAGGTSAAFEALQQNYITCLEAMGDA
ncbi:MAG: J domain-containing protein [Oscillospiraceae bacterium]|jgi:hypothetical protein|nr:J domain-containing protein [Oscillospiraceae bacterium]